MSETRVDKQICWNCGESVAPGSGRFVNRIPSGDDYETRKEEGADYPEGGWLCYECDQSFDVEAILDGSITVVCPECGGNDFKSFDGDPTLIVCLNCDSEVTPDQCDVVDGIDSRDRELTRLLRRLDDLRPFLLDLLIELAHSNRGTDPEFLADVIAAEVRDYVRGNETPEGLTPPAIPPVEEAANG